MSVGITHDYDTDNKCYGIQGETVSKLGECSIAGQTWRMGRIWKEQRTRVNVQMGEEIKWYEQLRWQYASCVRRVTLSVWIDTIVKGRMLSLISYGTCEHFFLSVLGGCFNNVTMAHIILVKVQFYRFVLQLIWDFPETGAVFSLSTTMSI